MNGNNDILSKVFRGAFMVLVCTAIFWGGYELGSVKTELNTHSKLDMHEGARENFVPRTELENRLERIEQSLEEIKAELK